MSSLLDRLRGGLIVSVQAATNSALDDPQIISAMARAAAQGGAVGLRIEGERNLRAVRAAIDLPIVGIVKREYAGFEPYITPTLREVREVLACGTQIVALDATARPRSGDQRLARLSGAIHEGGALAMAD